MSEKTIIEVNGVKLEVDLRHARRIEEIRVGDKVKVLTKNYGDTFSVNAGVVMGFEPFKNLPTIVVAYLVKDWSKAEIKFLHYNAQSKDIEIIKADADDDMEIERDMVLRQIDNQIASFHRQIAEAEERKRYFLANFASYWSAIAPTREPEAAQ